LIAIQPTADLLTSSEFTYNNMRSYYEHYGVDWELKQIHEQISSLDNWDILVDGEVVGAIRLAFDEEGCYLRDLQVAEQFQNKGIGAQAIKEVETLALKAGCQQLRLRVFKISPAYNLYVRVGFVVDKEEDRFYYLSKKL